MGYNKILSGKFGFFLKKEIEVHIIEENIHRDFKFRILFFYHRYLRDITDKEFLNMTMEELCVSVSAKVASRLFKCKQPDHSE